ncbi:glycosyltransferase, partial [Patescibacteria group bacterium]|nr:glycosyltransferase [Patescibacteria group bacterium]
MSENSPILSVIVPTYNSLGTLRLCIEALLKQQLPYGEFEVIIVDDGSTDGTKNFIDSLVLPKEFSLKYVFQENAGPAKARNTGIKKAIGRIIAFTDADCIPDPDWLNVIKKSIVDGGLNFLSGKTYTNDFLVFPWKVAPVDQVGVTANLAFDRYHTKETMYFDETFMFPIGEDLDFVLRCEKVGYKITVVENMRVCHPPHVFNVRGLMRRAKYRSGEVILDKKFGTASSSSHRILAPIYPFGGSPAGFFAILVLLTLLVNLKAFVIFFFLLCLGIVLAVKYLVSPIYRVFDRRA